MCSKSINDPLKINLQTKNIVIDKIKENFEETLTIRFKQGNFKHFIYFSITNQSFQLMLHLIHRICKSKSTSQLNLLNRREGIEVWDERVYISN